MNVSLIMEVVITTVQTLLEVFNVLVLLAIIYVTTYTV